MRRTLDAVTTFLLIFGRALMRSGYGYGIPIYPRVARSAGDDAGAAHLPGGPR